MIDLEKVTAIAILALLFLGFWLVLRRVYAPEPVAEPVAVQCEVRAVHPSVDGGYVITCVIPKGALP